MRILATSSSRLTLGVVALLLALLAWWLWPTETRRVAKAIKGLEQAAEAGDWQSFMTGVSPRYNYEGFTHAQLAAWTQRLKTLVGDLNIYVLRKRINVQGNLASASLDLIATSSGSSSRFSGTDRSSWQLSFRKENGQWLLRKVTPVKVGFGRRMFSSLRELKAWVGQ